MHCALMHCVIVVMNLTIHSLVLFYRSTAFGIHSGIGRVGAILGNVTFGHLIDSDRSLPILLVASFLSVGAIAAVFLPPVYRPENRPPLQRALAHTCAKFTKKKQDITLSSSKYENASSQIKRHN